MPTLPPPPPVLRVYDTLSGRKVLLKKARGGAVKILLCGPTVYDYSHAGHARMLLLYDLFACYLRAAGMRATVVVNITDIDPKVFARAKEQGVPPADLAARFVGELAADLARLGIAGFVLARVSDYAHEAARMVRELVEKGRAYSAGGNVYLDTSGARGFGSLAGMSRQDIEDCRLDIAPGKKSPADILLWNASGGFGVTFSDSTLGSGIPWWHMQDSSVAMANFDGMYDVHGGAEELVYPHHESHLAQLQALTGAKKPVGLWTHVGLVYAKGSKMSKSRGNTILARDLVKRYGANALRLYLYSEHYRRRLVFSEKALERYAGIDAEIAGALVAPADSCSSREGRNMVERFMARIGDDFDTPGAMKIMQEEAIRKPSAWALGKMLSVFGLGY